MAGAGNRRTASTGGGGGGSGGSGTGGFTAPTPGLEDVKFAAGTPEAAAIYEKSVERLTEHIGIQAWRGVSELTQAIEKMKNVEYEEPEEPVRLYYSNEDKTSTTTEPTKEDGSPHTPVTSDGLYAVELQRYVNQHKSWEVKDSQYNENRSRAFNLILQHCPEPVKVEVK